ncbi:hypothetical protein DIPPA_62917 [Diplonema papillatum]|nr:hypothetical protein DIPPA_62917 [Diplonema papillatum]
MQHWTVEDVSNWVHGLSPKTTYREAFRRHEIDGKALLDLEEDDLKRELGIVELGIRRSILRAIGVARAEKRKRVLKSPEAPVSELRDRDNAFADFLAAQRQDNNALVAGAETPSIRAEGAFASNSGSRDVGLSTVPLQSLFHRGRMCTSTAAHPIPTSPRQDSAGAPRHKRGRSLLGSSGRGAALVSPRKNSSNNHSSYSNYYNASPTRGRSLSSRAGDVPFSNDHKSERQPFRLISTPSRLSPEHTRSVSPRPVSVGTMQPFEDSGSGRRAASTRVTQGRMPLEYLGRDRSERVAEVIANERTINEDASDWRRAVRRQKHTRPTYTRSPSRHDGGNETTHPSIPAEPTNSVRGQRYGGGRGPGGLSPRPFSSPTNTPPAEDSSPPADSHNYYPSVPLPNIQPSAATLPWRVNHSDPYSVCDTPVQHVRFDAKATTQSRANTLAEHPHALSHRSMLSTPGSSFFERSIVVKGDHMVMQLPLEILHPHSPFVGR